MKSMEKKYETMTITGEPVLISAMVEKLKKNRIKTIIYK